MTRQRPLMASTCAAAAKSSMPSTLAELSPTRAVVLFTRSLPLMPASQRYGLTSKRHLSSSPDACGVGKESALSVRLSAAPNFGCDRAGAAVAAESDAPSMSLPSNTPFTGLSCAKALAEADSRRANNVIKAPIIFDEFLNSFLLINVRAKARQRGRPLIG